MKLFSRFSRKRKVLESAPQLGYAQRKALEFVGSPPGTLTYATYDQMQQDSMVQTALTLKKLGVLAAPSKIEPADDSPEAKRRTEFVEETFARMAGSPHTILAHAMDAFAKGWSILELLWAPKGNRLWLQEMKPKDPSLFGLKVDAFGAVQGLELQVPGESPITVPKEKFAIFVHRRCYANPKGTSDLDAAYAHWTNKRKLLGAWQLHLERFASPTVLGKFARGMPAVDRDSVLDKLSNLHRSAAITIPEEVAVDTLGSKGEGSAAFLEAVDYHNREIARAVLGQTLTTDEGRRVGSLALGKVHLQVLLLQLESIRRELADAFLTEQVIRPIVELNFGPGPIPTFRFETAAFTAFAKGEIE